MECEDGGGGADGGGGGNDDDDDDENADERSLPRNDHKKVEAEPWHMTFVLKIRTATSIVFPVTISTMVLFGLRTKP